MSLKKERDRGANRESPEDKHRGTGRSTAGRLQTLATASANPDKWIEHKDHWARTSIWVLNCKRCLEADAKALGLTYQFKTEKNQLFVRFPLKGMRDRS